MKKNRTRKIKKILIIGALVIVFIIIIFLVINNQKMVNGKYKSIFSDTIVTTIEFIPSNLISKSGLYKTGKSSSTSSSFGEEEGEYKQKGNKIIFENINGSNLDEYISKSLGGLYGDELVKDGNYLIDLSSDYDGAVPNSKTFNAIISSKYTKYEFKEDGSLIIDGKKETKYERKGNVITYKILLKDGVSEQTVNLYVYDGKIYDTVYRKVGE